MKVNLFGNNFDRFRFHDYVVSNCYAETQEGYNHLASIINQRIDSHFYVELILRDDLTIVISHSGLLNRVCAVAVKHNDLISDISEIENILIAFASGIGYDC